MLISFCKKAIWLFIRRHCAWQDIRKSLNKHLAMISRDGTLVSLWQDSMNPYRSKNRIDHDAIYDIAIVGGGITGISTGLLLQNAGKKCILLEAANLGFGTTGGTTAHLNTLLDTPYTTIIKNFGKENARLVKQAVGEAIGLIKKNISDYGIDCAFRETDAYLFSQNEEQQQELQEIYEACTELGLDIEFAGSIPVAIPFGKAVRIKHQAKFHPLQYIYALARAFEEAGGTIVQHCRVTDVKQNEWVEIQTEAGSLKSSQLIYATHIPPGINLLNLRCAPYRSYAIAVELENDNYPEGLVYDMYDPYHYYRSQQVNGKTWLIAGGEDHKTGHDENTESHFLKLESHLQRYFSVKEISYKWSSQYFEPVDGLPYIGHLPGHPENIFVATGYGGNGMTYSSVAALLLTDMILNRDSAYIKLFDPNRIKPIAGFSNFIKENADVVKQLVGKWFSKEKIQQLADLAPGEGKLIRFEGQPIALYKDEDGSLHAVDPVCTHMKCTVSWNTSEKTWDCPCHGTRYSFDGKLLTGPATTDLEKIELKELIAH